MNAADGSPRRRKRRLLTGYDESGVSVKQEPDDDIKDYAETTMNELLGWYGYEKVDSRDTQGLNLQHFAASATSPASTPEGSGSEDPTQGVSRPPSGRAGSVSPSQEGSSLASDAVARQHQQMVSALSAIPKHPGAPESPNLPPGCIVCAWCQKVGMKLFTLKTPNGCKAFCSELCFTQCRRASFKKNKVCDWCKHVRHTVNYVDFQDGEQQLQFCSDKCLNQYKMNIFCKETQAHLQMHTHLKEAACKMAASGSVNLITPELWLRDCKTHSNGHSHSSNEAIEVREDVNSHENVSVITSAAQMSSSEPLNVSLREEKETRHHFNRIPREKDKLRRPGRSSSKHSSGKNGDDIQSHHHIRHRDRTIGGSGSVNTSSNPNPSTPQMSPTTGSHSTLMNGPSPNLSSPPIGASPRPQPPHHQHHQQQAHHGPPLPSPIGLGMDHMRPPFLPPGLIPPPFHLFAQQQMEAFLRAQHGIGMRPGAPPVPFPPWVVPPFPHMVPPPPPHRPPPPLPSGSSGSSSHPGQHSQPSPKSQPPPQAHPVPPPPHHHHPTAPQPSSSLLPPVTVMVPFPVVLPLPVPIPIPIPIPSHIIEKFKKQKQEQQQKEQQKSNQQQQQRYQQQQPGHEKKNSPSENRESNFNNETLLDTSDSDGSISNATNSKDLNSKRVESVINRLVNVRSGSWIANRRSLPFQDSDTVTQNDIPSRNTNHSKSQRKDSELTMDGRITDLDSRSYSPLSEIISTDDDNTGDDILDSDVEQGSRLTFSNYTHSAMSSSLSTSVTNTTEYSKPWGLANNRMTILRSPSPPHRFLGEKRNVTDQSSTQINNKRKCIRDKVNSVS